MLLVTLGGLALFLLGLQRIVDGMQELAGAGARRAMEGATRSPWRALATGIGVGAASQSGTATTISAVGLVAAGIMAVPAGIAYSLGAQVGATLAIQLAAFRISAYALPMIGVGFLAIRWRRTRTVGDLVLGAGLVFLGLALIVDSMGALLETPAFALVLATLDRSPLAMAAVGLAVGTFVTSSNAATALALGLVAAGGSSLPAAAAFVAGGNAGATVITLVAARELGTAAVRVAGMHTLIKIAAAFLLALVAVPFADLLAALGGDGGRQVANAHSLFNTLVAVPGTLLAGAAGAIGGRLWPARQEEIGPRYLGTADPAHPAWALGVARREVERISDEVLALALLAARGLRTGRWDVTAVTAREVRIDRLARAVLDHLADVRRRHGPDAVSEHLLAVVTELETIARSLRRIEEREVKLRGLGIEYSREGRAELAGCAEALLQRMRTTFTALAVGHKGLARQVIAGRPAYERLIAERRLAHLARLEARLAATHVSHMQHLEVLSALRMIDASITRVAGYLVHEGEPFVPSDQG